MREVQLSEGQLSGGGGKERGQLSEGSQLRGRGKVQLSEGEEGGDS